jgi:hypothetical protein
MNYELPSAPLSIGGILDNAIRLYRFAIRRCWILALVYAGVVGGFTLFWTLTLANSVKPGSTDPRQVLAAMSAIFSPVAIVGFLVAMVISMALYGGLVKSISAIAQGNMTLSFGEAVAVGLRRIPGVLLGALISALSVCVGLILLVIPGIYLIGKLQLWLVAMFMEDVGALESLSISWRLTRKRWWRATVIVSVALVLVYVVPFTFGLVSGLIGVLAHLSVTNRAIVDQGFGVVSNLIVLPMAVCISVAMYHDFKLRGEGGDLAVRMGALSKT